jgi:hypothetical protein
MTINLAKIVTLFLTTGKKEKRRVPYRSGLNWGQRPNRNQNQAYLSIPADIQRSGFFPETGIPFNMICDDGYAMICARAQQNGKALHSIKNNAIMGMYFRDRLNLGSGELVTIQHLENYGRLYVNITRSGDGEYYLDFSSPK